MDGLEEVACRCDSALRWAVGLALTAAVIAGAVAGAAGACVGWRRPQAPYTHPLDDALDDPHAAW